MEPSLPILSYIVVFTGLAIAVLGVSFNENDALLKYSLLTSSGFSVEREGYQCHRPLFVCAWSSPLLSGLPPLCPSSTDNARKALVLIPGQM